MIRLEKAKTTDVALLVEIHRQTIASSWNEKDFLESLERSDKIVYLIIYEDVKVGYIMVSVLVPEAEIINFAIIAKFQAKGIGAKSINILLQKLFSNGVSKVFLEVRQKSKAVSFYLRQGFEVIGTRNNYYANGEDAWMMQKSLADFQ